MPLTWRHTKPSRRPSHDPPPSHTAEQMLLARHRMPLKSRNEGAVEVWCAHNLSELHRITGQIKPDVMPIAGIRDMM